MTDVRTPEARRHNMAAIRNADTKPEVWLRKKLFAMGFRFRKNVKSLLGKPDIVLPKYKAIILVNGCFWHGHDCHLFKIPKTRTELWLEKIRGNQDRDRKNIEKLEKAGWRVLVVRECDIKDCCRLTEAELTERIINCLVTFAGSSDIAGLSQESDHAVRETDRLL